MNLEVWNSAFYDRDATQALKVRVQDWTHYTSVLLCTRQKILMVEIYSCFCKIGMLPCYLAELLV